jgi:hypothetical protein
MRRRGFKRVKKARQVLEEVLEFSDEDRLAIASGQLDIAALVKKWKGRKRIEIISVRLVIQNQFGIHQQKNVVSSNSLDDYFGPSNPLWTREGVQDWVWGVVIRYVKL